MPQWRKQSEDRREKVFGQMRLVAGIVLLTLIAAACSSGGTEAGSEPVSSTVANETSSTEAETTTTAKATTTTSEASTSTEPESTTTEEPTTTAAPTTAAPTTAAPTTAAPTTAAPTTAAPTTAAPTTAAPTTAAPTTAAPTTAAPTTAAPISGSGLFATNCARCHGADGAGVTGPSLQGSADKFTFGQMVGIVTNGAGGMPSFGAKLSAAEIDAVVAHARGF